MKKLYKYLFMVVSAVALLPLMMACSDDESTDPYDVNYVYIYSPAETNGEMVYKGNGTFLTKIASERNLTPVRCTKPASERLVAHFTIDGSLVDAYNKEHGTNYTFVKSAQLDNATLVIEQGKYISADSLKLKLTDMTEFQNGAENYILPIVMTSVEGGGVSMSQTSKMFLTFTSTYKANKVIIASGASTSLYFDTDGELVNPENTERMYWNGMISSEWAADEDITLSLEINNNLIDTYNALNGTNCEPMPTAALETSVMHIKKGQMGPEEVFALTFSDKMASLELGKDYIVPVSITEVTGVGAEANKEKSTAYLVFNTRKNPNIYVGTAPTGTKLTADSNWKVTVDGSYDYNGNGTPWNKIVTSPGSFVGYVFTDEDVLLDMGEAKEVSSIIMNYYYYSYCGYGKTKISFSLDGQTFEDEECSLEPAQTQVVLCKKPVQARYIRINYSKTYSSYYGACLTGLRIYTPSTEE